jgi:hypothetical protein
MGARRLALGHLSTLATPEIFTNFYLLLSTHRVQFTNILTYNNKKVFFCDQELWISCFFTKISSGKFGKLFLFKSLNGDKMKLTRRELRKLIQEAVRFEKDRKEIRKIRSEFLKGEGGKNNVEKFIEDTLRYEYSVYDTFEVRVDSSPQHSLILINMDPGHVATEMEKNGIINFLKNEFMDKYADKLAALGGKFHVVTPSRKKEGEGAYISIKHLDDPISDKIFGTLNKIF